MIEADHSGHLPRSIFFLPEMDELRLTYRIGCLVSGMVKAVHSNLHRAIVGNGIDLERPGHKFSGHLAADIVLDTLDQRRAPAAQPSLVVIELQIVGEQGAEFFKIAMVVGVEELGVEGLDSLEKRIGRGRGLGMQVSQRRSEQSCNQQRLQRSENLDLLYVHAGTFLRGSAFASTWEAYELFLLDESLEDWELLHRALGAATQCGLWREPKMATDQIKVKGSGQECPLHTGRIRIREMGNLRKHFPFVPVSSHPLIRIIRNGK